MHETGTKWLLDQKSLHLLFELCLGFKALFALAEIVTGVATYLVPQRYFLTLVVSVTRDEFAEDPHVIERHTDAGLAYCASHSPRHDVGKWNVPLPPGFASYLLAKMSSGGSPSPGVRLVVASELSYQEESEVQVEGETDVFC